VNPEEEPGLLLPCVSVNPDILTSPNAGFYRGLTIRLKRSSGESFETAYKVIDDEGNIVLSDAEYEISATVINSGPWIRVKNPNEWNSLDISDAFPVFRYVLV